MFCEKCGKQMDDADKFCMNCGWQVPAKDEVKAEPVEEAVAAEATATENAVADANTTAEPATVEPAATETTTVEPVTVEAASAEPEVKNVQEESKAADNKEKLSFLKNKPLLIGAGCALVVLVLILANISGIIHFCYATFASPEKYYSYIEKREAKEAIEAFLNYYDRAVDNMDWSDKKVETDVSVELSEEVRDLIGFTGIDVEWLERATFGADVNIKNQRIGVGAELALNKEKLVSANIALDCPEETMYIQVPELIKTYLGIEFDDMDMDYDDDVWEQMKAAADAMPDSKKIGKLMNKYVDIALDTIEDVEKDKGTLKTKEVSQKCTELEITIDEDAMQDMLEAVLEAMQDDEELEALIVTYGDLNEDVTGMDGDDMYEAFEDEIDDMLDSLDYLMYDDEEIVMTLWVDGKGVVRGRSIEYMGDEISVIMPQKGSKYGFEAQMETSYGETVALVGNGKRSGNKLDGEFSIKYNSSRLVDIVVDDYNTEKIKEGTLNGCFTVSLSDAAGTLVGMTGVEGLAGLSDYSIQMDIAADDSKQDCVFKLYDEDEKIATVEVNSKMGSGSKVSVPSSKNVEMAKDADDMEDWVEDMEFEGLLKTLEDKVGVPSKWIKLAEEVLDL